MSRRRFVTSTAAASLSTLAIGAAPVKPAGAKKPIIVASGNGLRAVEKAMELVRKGHDPLDAAIEGVAIVEADPKDHSVGYGGLPNEDGVVELDAAVMHGPTHGGGSVASIRNIMHPAAVARLVMQRTRHCLLVGEGALRFARAHGFPEVNLLTDESPARSGSTGRRPTTPRTTGCRPPTRRSPPYVREYVANRVTGHDPLLGARHARRPGLHDDHLGPVLEDPRPRRRFADPGRGAVPGQRGRLGRLDRRGRGEPAQPFELSDRRGDAARAAPQGRDHGDLQDESPPPAFATPSGGEPDGKTTFNVSFYAVSKDGKFAGGSIYPGGKMAVHDGDSARIVPCDPLFDKVIVIGCMSAGLKTRNRGHAGGT